jgi:hypothetical protein
MNKIDELLKELREIAKQNLIDRDMWGICENDIDEEVNDIVVNNLFGREESK